MFLKKLIFSLVLCLGGGMLAGLITETGIKEWYPHLVKPYGTPPKFIFPIVWTLLYTMMAIALTLLWSSPTVDKKRAFTFFGIQLFLNFIWSWLFFYLQKPGLALLDLVLLWVFILLTIQALWRHSRYASLLLVPYLAWVSYALYLNLFIWIYN